MQFLNNIPSDFKLTQYFKPFYELYSVKTLPTQLSVDRAFARILNIVNAKAKQPLLTLATDKSDNSLQFDFRHLSGCRGNKAFIAFSGGKDCLATAIRAEQDGYYIGRLVYDRQLYRWFVNDCFGSKHYPSRAVAEKICKRFKSIYKLQ